MKKATTWEDLFNLYNTIKYHYALCEELDPELTTNLQPLNEFRASLDHIMRIIAIEKLPEYKDRDAEQEMEKLYGHLSRAFFDISDLLSIYYRQRICDTLKPYSPNVIESAIPDYYPTIRPRLVEIEQVVAKIRTDKRFPKSEKDMNAVDFYSQTIVEIREYYQKIVKAVPSLIEIKKKDLLPKVLEWLIPWLLPAIIAIIQLLMSK